MTNKTNQIEIEKAYQSTKYEKEIYKQWEESGAFKANVDKDKKPFSISLPPPNATGTLHLGHSVMLSIQDIMIRRHRMMGDSALWLPGTDHAAIATQSVVERELQKKGIKNPREELGREGLLARIQEFVEKSKLRIRDQMREIGASCDWEREKYTLDEDMNHAVNTFFKNMYEDDIIYRGGRMVNWDPEMKTTVADDEIEHIEETTEFYYFQYGPVVIGTARPETKFQDKVIVVHPDDRRYKDLIGKEFEVEWIEGKIKTKVIADKGMDMELGTGAMTITPSHSMIDYDLAMEHDLEVKQIIDFDGKILKSASEEFGGLSIAEARKKVTERLKEKGLLVKIDKNYKHNVAVNYRGKGKVEPQIMKQWFIDVNKKTVDWKGEKLSLKEVMQDVVNSKMIKIIPSRFEKTYFNWIDNLKDWCISRQIWWGHQIPVWYKVTEEEFKKFNETKNNSTILLTVMDLDKNPIFSEEKPQGDFWIRDPDTLDTWFSSALWTFATLGWPNNTEEMEYFHPTTVMETGYDIIFFWVARMILASTYNLRREGKSEEKSIPFKTVYLHGMIKDIHGKKMSKSRPEFAIDPLEMIEKYGADALRLSLVIGSTPGNDTRLYEEKIAGYRNFINKIWNAGRFVLMNSTKEDLEHKFTPKKDIKHQADKWIVSKMQQLILDVNKDMDNYRFSDAGNKMYEFFWGTYCDWYLELSKDENKNSAVLIYILKNVLKLLHPYTPFVTEKLWSYINNDSLLIKEEWPEINKNLINKKEEGKMEKINEIIASIRRIRAELKIEPAKKINVTIISEKNYELIAKEAKSIKRLSRVEQLNLLKEKIEMKNTHFEKIGEIEVHIQLDGLIDKEKEKLKIKKEIEEKEKYASTIKKKLSNKGFTKNAPQEIIKKEEEKLKETEEEINTLRVKLSKLTGK